VEASRDGAAKLQLWNAGWEHATLLGFRGFTTVRACIGPFLVAWTDDPRPAGSAC
jgi:hypothetical protein